MVQEVRALVYGRVSSDRQEHEETIHSQLEELRVRAGADGLNDWLELIDEGYSRDNLARPGLDTARDLISDGEYNRVYIQSPDRLASGAKLMILVEEFQEHGVEIIFLKGSFDDTPEGKLLLHVQGAFAEYETAKTAERTRRGKQYWARHGALVGYFNAYGYRFIKRTETSRARLEINEYESAVVREMYRWLTEEEMSTRSIGRRLTELGIPTAKGAAQWQPTAVDKILRREANKGTFIYQKAQRAVPGSGSTPRDPYRQNRKSGRRARPKDEWIPIRVPAIVDEATWEAAQRQLEENSRYSMRNNKRHTYLLKGLMRCSRCGGMYTGHAQHRLRRYRCINSDASVSSTGKKCTPGSVSADKVEVLVWDAVSEALQQPEVLAQEYEKRLAEALLPASIEIDKKQISLALKRVRAQEDRVTEAYINEAMGLERYKDEMVKLRARREQLERAAEDMERSKQREQDSKRALENLRGFCDRVAKGLGSLTFGEKQKLLRLVVERITITDGKVKIETIIPTGEDPVQLRTRHPEPVEGCATKVTAHAPTTLSMAYPARNSVCKRRLASEATSSIT